MSKALPVFAAAGALAFAASSDHVTPATSAQQPTTAPVLVQNGLAQAIPTVAQGTTTVAGTVSLASGTQVGVAGPITIANDQPILVQDVNARHMITVSSLLTYQDTAAPDINAILAPPTCPQGQEFLVT